MSLVDPQDLTCAVDSAGELDRKPSARSLRRAKRDLDREQQGASQQGRGGSAKKPRGGSAEKSCDGSTAGDTAGEPQNCTDASGMDPHEKEVMEADDEKTKMAYRSTFRCIIKIEFCDEQRNKKKSSLPTEKIYVLLTAKNPTNQNVYVTLRGAGPEGLIVGSRTSGLPFSIRGIKGRYTPSGEQNKDRMVKIPRSKSYTFFRLFSAVKGPNHLFSSIWTPTKEGTYTGVVFYGKNEMAEQTFEITGSS